jgi:ribosomal protein L28
LCPSDVVEHAGRRPHRRWRVNVHMIRLCRRTEHLS